jgi:hypothetical protein
MEGRIPFTGLMDDVKIFNQQRNLTICNLALPTKIVLSIYSKKQSSPCGLSRFLLSLRSTRAFSQYQKVW